MNDKPNLISGTILLTLLGGATLGVMAVTFASPKKGKVFLKGIKALVARLKSRGEVDDEGVLVAFI